MMKNYVPRTAKLEQELNAILEKVCSLNSTSVSSFIRAAIIDKLKAGAVSNIAGQNKIQYNPENDTFTWAVELDDSTETIVLESLSSDFLKDLKSKMQFELNKRDELLNKRKDKSVSIPKSLVRH